VHRVAVVDSDYDKDVDKCLRELVVRKGKGKREQGRKEEREGREGKKTHTQRFSKVGACVPKSDHGCISL